MFGIGQTELLLLLVILMLLALPAVIAGLVVFYVIKANRKKDHD
jgi:hypothetical protein